MRAIYPALLAGVALLSGCGIELGERPTPPPEAVAVGVYTRGAPEMLSFSYVVTSEHSDPRTGEVTTEARGGCFWVGGAWTLEVHEGGAPDAAQEPLATIESDDPPVSPTEIGISIDAAGRVELTEGVPEWWGTRDRQRCGL